MPAETFERVLIGGPAGKIETDINDPGGSRRGIALVAHPNPVQGGTKDNKVVTTLAKTFFSLGYIAVRPNFRGVGASGGVHDEGRGETEDMMAVVEYLTERHRGLPFALAGFSFGSFVQTQVAGRMQFERLVLVAPAVNRFPTGAVRQDTLVIHGERDDVVPLSAVLDWARPQGLPIIVVPGGGHFFHGRLALLSQILVHHHHP